MRRLFLITLVATLLGSAGAAQAVVVNDAGTTYGVAMVPPSGSYSPPPGSVGSPPPCTDPWLSPDLGGPILPNNALCWHEGTPRDGGQVVMHGNETFTLTWDPLRRYWATTRGYVQRFLRDVADGSGTLTSPYAATPQYHDHSGNGAGNQSVYGGGCIDYGNAQGAYTCQLGGGNPSVPGNTYGASGCPRFGSDSQAGVNQYQEQQGGGFGPAPNDVCITDAQVQSEVRTMTDQIRANGGIKPGYAPVVMVLLPPGVVTCLDGGGTFCSANSTAAQRFCSYHSHLTASDGTEFAYVVQPWVGSWSTQNGCDEPDATQIPPNPPVDVLAKALGDRLTSPLSRAHMSAIVNPWLDGWYAEDGSEMGDNGCRPYGNQLDKVTVGNSSQNPYHLQREFNNAGVIETDPNALECTPNVLLNPSFVAPSAVNQGDTVEFDGSATASSLIVPRAGYSWNFGDGTTATGPSVAHTFTTAGTFTVTLTVTDRGGNVRTLSQTVQVLDQNGNPVSPTPGPGSGPAPSGGGGGAPGSSAFSVNLRLMPQALRSLLHSGIGLRINSNQRADAIVTISISRRDARRAHFRTGRSPYVVVGRGTFAGVKVGTSVVRLHFSHSMAVKLRQFHRLTMSVRVAFATKSGEHRAVDVAGRY